MRTNHAEKNNFSASLYSHVSFCDDDQQTESTATCSITARGSDGSIVLALSLSFISSVITHKLLH